MEDKSISFQLKLSKKAIILGIIFLVVLIFAGFELKFQFVEKTFAYFNRATATVKVVDKATKKPIADVVFSAENLSSKTDISGVASLDKLPKGQTDFDFAKAGYVSTSISVNLSRGANDLGAIELVEKKNLSTITGKVENLITKQPVNKALVSVSDATGNSIADGSFKVTQATMQKTKIKITVAGYLDYEKDINIVDKTMDLATIDLVPRGELLFTSDRDGSSAIYSANLDGSNATKLIDNVGLIGSGGEGGPGGYTSSFWISPDNKHLLYQTSGEKDSGDKPKYLYVADVNGQNVKKLSDDANPVNISWASKSTIVYSTYGTSSNNDMGHLKSVDISGNNLTQLDESVANSTYSSISNVAVSSQGLVAYTVYYNGAADKTGTYLVNVDGTNRRKTTTKSCDYALSFSPDGTTLYCQLYDNGVKNYQINTATVEAQEGTNPFSKNNLINSPDGKKVIFVDNRDGQSNLYSKDVNGNNEKKLTTDGYVESGTWSTSGKIVAYISGKDGLFVKAISPDGGDGIKITSCNGSSLAVIDN